MASNLRIGGLASGMDIDSMVRDMMAAARKPVDKLVQDKMLLQWKKEDYRTMNSQLRILRDLAGNMRLQGTFLSRKTTSSDDGVVTAVAANNSALANYDIKVEGVASPTVYESTADLPVDGANKTLNELFPDTANFSFKINDQSFDIDPSTETLNSLLKKISSDSKAGVTAFFASTGDGKGKVVLTSKQTGIESEIKITDDNSGFFSSKLNLAKTTEGKDAIVVINGVETVHQSNEFTINGTTFTLNGKINTSAKVSVTQDSEAVFDTIKNFVEKYNEVIDKLSTEVKEERHRDFPPLTEEQKKDMKENDIKLWEEKARSGMLRNDPLLNNILDKMRFAWSNPVAGLDAKFDQMTDFGIETGNYFEGGKLYIKDEQKLKDAINNNPEEVIKFFTQSSEEDSNQGVGFRLYDLLNNAMKDISKQAGSSDNPDLYDQSVLAESMRNIDKRIAEREERLKMMEDRYWSKFSAMEQAIQRANNQSMWLFQQFSQ